MQSAFAAAGALRENIEDELRAIENFAREQGFQIAALRRRKLIVKDDRRNMSILARVFDHFRFSLADVVRRGRFLQFLRDRIDNFRAGGIRQLS